MMSSPGVSGRLNAHNVSRPSRRRSLWRFTNDLTPGPTRARRANRCLQDGQRSRSVFLSPRNLVFHNLYADLRSSKTWFSLAILSPSYLPCLTHINCTQFSPRTINIEHCEEGVRGEANSLAPLKCLKFRCNLFDTDSVYTLRVKIICLSRGFDSYSIIKWSLGSLTCSKWW